MSRESNKCDYGGEDECPNEPVLFCLSVDKDWWMALCSKHSKHCKERDHVILPLTATSEKLRSKMAEEHDALLDNVNQSRLAEATALEAAQADVVAAAMSYAADRERFLAEGGQADFYFEDELLAKCEILRGILKRMGTKGKSKSRGRKSKKPSKSTCPPTDHIHMSECSCGWRRKGKKR